MFCVIELALHSYFRILSLDTSSEIKRSDEMRYTNKNSGERYKHRVFCKRLLILILHQK